MKVLGLQGLTTSDGIEKLVAVYGNDFHVWNSTLDIFDGESIPVTNNTRKWRSTVFLDKAFFVNGWSVTSAGVTTVHDNSKRYDGTSWQDEWVAKTPPMAKYIHQLNDKMYLGNLFFKTRSEIHPSWVWFTNLPDNNDITYGFVEGLSLNGIRGDTRVFTNDPTIYFKSRGLKIGDPIFIDDLGKTVFIAQVQTERSLILTEPLEQTLTNSDFWAGGNYFEVSTNDGDEITALGSNTGRLLVFKRDSLYRFTPGLSSSLVKVRGVPGTTSQESVVNIKDYTYYFHDTGLWRTDGTSSQLVSRGVQDYINAMSPDTYPDVVAWPTNNGESVRVFIGDVSDVDSGIDIDNCFIDFDTVTEKCTPGHLPFGITCKTEFRESNTSHVYLGTDDGRVVQADVTNMDIDQPISFMINTGFKFPTTTGILNEFTQVQIFSREAVGSQVMYKLYGTPFTIDKDWRALGDIRDNVTEFLVETKFERKNTARGIAYLVTNETTNKRPVIEKIDTFYKPKSRRSASVTQS